MLPTRFGATSILRTARQRSSSLFCKVIHPKSIGLRLNITTGTVKVHRRNVYRKLGISSQTQLLSIYLKKLNEH